MKRPEDSLAVTSDSEFHPCSSQERRTSQESPAVAVYLMSRPWQAVMPQSTALCLADNPNAMHLQNLNAGLS